MLRPTHQIQWAMGLLTILAWPLAAQTGVQLNPQEEDKLREAQEPGQRIVVYLDFLQERLERFDSYRHRPVDPKYDQAGYLEDVISEYIALDEEMKNWIDYQYEHNGDMRSGLKALIERGPRQLVTLRAIQGSPDPYSKQYGDSLRDAIDQLNDAIDGATKGLADQEKKFGELKKQEQEEKRISKERRKEESKRTKEEKKQRKQKDKDRVPGDIRED